MTLTNHLYTAGATVINNDWLLEQSEEFQKAVAESAAIAQAYSYPDLVNTEDKMLEMLRKQMEVIELNEEEMAKFIEISKGTWDEAAKIIGADYFNSIKEAIERMGY
jgi:TRAP-type C4-dicarboxylate transport system substrate-binding protein